MAHHRKQKKAAFSFIEVLIALFIAAFTCTSTYYLTMQAINIFWSASARIDAINDARCAMEYLRTLSFDDSDLDVGTRSKTLSSDQYYDLDFRYSVAKFNSNEEIKNITVQVDWTSKASGVTRFVELNSLLSGTLHSGEAVAISDTFEEGETPSGIDGNDDDDSGDGKSNNGHGNNEDGVDSSNPGNSKEGEDTDPTVDDEKSNGNGSSDDGNDTDGTSDQNDDGDEDKKDKKDKGWGWKDW